MPRILIIDDEAPVREICASILTLAGHQVTTAADGFEGTNQVRREAPDLILLDLSMPYGGLPTLRVVRGQCPDVPIIAMSGSRSAQLELAAGLGAQRILAKPFAPEALVRAIADLLRETEKKSPGADPRPEIPRPPFASIAE
ncbi:MAG: srrA [Verrucomicrobia bacterium]|nr:srrA [Verrucomicrobiota bacterium]